MFSYLGVSRGDFDLIIQFWLNLTLYFVISGTFKMRKVDLQKEGYNPAVVKDKLYYLDAKIDKYVPLGNEEYEKIASGAIRLWS